MSDEPQDEGTDDETLDDELVTRVRPVRRFVMRGGELVEVTTRPPVETRG